MQTARRSIGMSAPRALRAIGWATRLAFRQGPCGSCCGSDRLPRSRAARADDTSRLPLVTRGSRRVLEAAGRPIGTADFLRQTELVRLSIRATRHSRQTADQSPDSRLPFDPVSQQSTRTDPTVMRLRRDADLDIFVSINFDPGAGLLTGIGFTARFRQPYPFGQEPPDWLSRTWRDRYLVVARQVRPRRARCGAASGEPARRVRFVTDQDLTRGGPNARTTKCQLVFWSRLGNSRNSASRSDAT